MSFTKDRAKIVVVQASPVIFNKTATIDKVEKITQSLISEKTDLVLFPEAFIPAYPRGLSFGALVGSRSDAGRRLWQRYWENSVDVPSDDTVRLGQCAVKMNAYLVIGVIEREKGTLYCTILYFDPLGRLIGKHRKLKPTGTERLIWGEGDGSTLSVFPTPIGNIGGLVCWENYMPLARTAMYLKGVEIYLAPTADSRECWQSTLKHIAIEGRCFVLGCNQFVTNQMYPDIPEFQFEKDSLPDKMCRGGSVVINPFGNVLVGPLYDYEGNLIVELDLNEITRGKFDFDVIGSYARNDVFKLIINEGT